MTRKWYEDEHRSIQRRALISGLAVMAAGLCVAGCASPPPDPTYREVYSGYRPTDADRRALFARQLAYWGALREKRYEAAYEFLTLDFQENLPLRAFRDAHPGLPASPEPTRLDWLQNSPRMPGPEVFAVVLWRAGPLSSPTAKGELVWRREPDDQFYIQSSEIRYK